MLSVPLIPPQDEGSLWLRMTYRPRSDSPPPAIGHNPQQNHRQRQQREEEKKLHSARSPLAILAADEAAIEQRKAAVRTFGSHWIRPPGVSKTLQAMVDEAQEREEQAEIDRQEAAMRDLEARQQLSETTRNANEPVDEMAPDRDLDEDIPDGQGADVTFNEESIMEGSPIELGEDETNEYAEMEEAELTGAARDEEELGLMQERNLDDSVPEAGSYQHTDTEVEESDSAFDENPEEDSLLSTRSMLTTRTSSAITPAPLAQLSPVLQQRIGGRRNAAHLLSQSPGILDSSSSLLNSSLIGSSPVMQRANSGAARRPIRSRRSRRSRGV